MDIKKVGNTQRITKKSQRILENVLVTTGKKTGANKIIEAALIKEYPLFSVMYDEGNKK